MGMRQAVVLIHGIGEQRPFENLESFVTAITQGSDIRNKPDRFDPLYELRRLQLPGDRSRPLTDFYELYWAHHMRDTRTKMVVAWLRLLLKKNPRYYNMRFLPIYIAGLLMLALVVFLLLIPLCQSYLFAVKESGPQISFTWRVILLSLLALVGAKLSVIIYGYVGDAARYLNPDPDNIEQRNSIRREGIELLDRLHASGKYVRIIVVGHSLGSVIGYDIITQYWSRLVVKGPLERYAQEEPNRFEHYVREFNAKDTVNGNDVELFRQRQHALWREYQAVKFPWLITDFITLGSPLTYADYLLAENPDKFKAKKASYEFSTCPPTIQEKDDMFFSYFTEGPQGKCNTTVPNHASVFSCTRWTNLYFPSRFVLDGDIISGPLAANFGRGIKDIALPAGPGKWLQHCKYWSVARHEGQQKEPVEVLKNMLMLDCLKAKGNWPLP